MEKTLYIIGNGFDISHDIQSEYKYFCTYLTDNSLSISPDIYPQFYTDMSIKRFNYCNIELWNEFEEQLSNFEVPCDIIENVKDTLKGLESYSSGDIDSEAAQDFIQHYVNKYIKSIESIKEYFNKWINQIDISHVIEGYKRGIKKYKFEDNANFLSFNYTKTLEEGYKIKKNKICHIHGKKGDSDLILGHSWSCEKPDEMSSEELRYLSIEYNNLNCEKEYKEKYTRNEFVINEEKLESDIKRDFRNNIITQLEKRTTDIMDSNDSFHSVLENVSKIVTIGHSLSEVDMPYFQSIKDIVSTNVVWCIGCFDQSARNKADNLKNKLGISDSCFKTFDSSRCFDLTKI